MSTKLVNPAALYDGAPVGMSQAKVDLESRFVFVSGQVDWTASRVSDMPRWKVRPKARSSISSRC
jgi:hypothetical protein